MGYNIKTQEIFCDFCGAKKPMAELLAGERCSSGWSYGRRDKPPTRFSFLLKDMKLEKHSCDHPICMFKIFMWTHV